jgi:CheY-like chemotaxis protein
MPDAKVGMPPLTIYAGQMAKKILVADDNPLIRKMLCRMFEIQEDYELCAEAENGQEAVALAIKHRPDLIILDMAMPVMNGIDAAREIKQVLPGVPIILFTQYGDLTMERAITNLSIDRVISKNDGHLLIWHIRSIIPA